MPRRAVLVWVALATIYLVWGSTYLAIRVMVETVPPLLGTGLRIFAAGTVFAAWVAAVRGRSALRVPRRAFLAAAAIGALLLLGGNGMVAVAEQEAPSGLAALMIGAVPLWVVVLRLVWRERLPLVTLAGVGLGFAGVALLVAPGDRPDDAPLWSLLLLVASAASWATGSFLSSRVPLPEDVVVATALQMLLGGALLILAGVAAGEAPELQLGDLSGRSIAAFVYLLVAGSLVAFTAYVWLLQNVPVSTVATYAFVNPVVAVLLGWLLLDEELTMSVISGTVVIVLSVAFVVRKETTAPPARATPAGETAATLDAAEPRA